jgi:hypothetical protein
MLKILESDRRGLTVLKSNLILRGLHILIFGTLTRPGSGLDKEKKRLLLPDLVNLVQELQVLLHENPLRLLSA